MLCAKWMMLSDGCVARCDKRQAHDEQEGHVDSVIAINFTDEDVAATQRRLAIGSLSTSKFMVRGPHGEPVQVYVPSKEQDQPSH